MHQLPCLGQIDASNYCTFVFIAKKL